QLSSTNGTLHMAEVMVMGCDNQVQPLLSDLDNLMNGISTSDKARLSEQDVMMYPIPSEGLINLYLGNFMNKKIAIEIFNSNGQKVFKKDYKSSHYAIEELQLQSLSEGVYQMSITSDQFFDVKPFMLLNKK
ncbi:T9SS type A sorting domain-containing protein, partial [Croceitalea sp. P059]|uniref:T9SS type A sorting domain-containing protein n=1 Tax=Croceitalea sp. P059 TaxID=3075601 RepID=UPI0028885278